ncbi:Glu/Leu/Phe/Val dehydrogenase [Alicyclobacillus sp. SO9]|uniref:Glu/Leu/Phe/Val dehydrogenase n=1 Tax=Alicyclobacillus sp. SO9 TaxID=2665646 RepID=UPI0018E70EEC|nr:Glu/Leu/Phe/Val dehydrogenase [Alicyclobacillus sp. SO9]QQE76869.1 Glu/Leu/Phe/Val dehydrogenase [Alicyclobacillus sp. SO9]
MAMEIERNKQKETEASTNGIFAQMEKYGHEQVIFNYDKATGLKSIVAIHDTTLGPALGGCRMWPYETEQEALQDVLRLSRGMTYKCAVSGESFGGGKSVIWADPHKDKSDELFQAFGSYIETMKGRFYTGTDVGTVSMDFVSARKQTQYLVGLPEEYGGSGNSAIITAYGVHKGMKATAKEAFGDESLSGKKIAVQGLGKVGKRLLDHLFEEGAIVTATDIFDDNIRMAKMAHPDLKIVPPEEIYGVECDIFSPNALGAVLNDNTIPRLTCKVICGAANNVLEDKRHGRMLFEQGILYAPDYVVNAGGLIEVAEELHGFNKERAFSKAEQIYDTLLQIYSYSRDKGIPTSEAADELVERKLDVISRIQSKYMC